MNYYARVDGKFFNGKKTLVLVGLWLFLPSVCYRGKIRDIKLPIVFKNDIKINQSDILAKNLFSFFYRRNDKKV